jgi:hypothetical protein
MHTTKRMRNSCLYIILVRIDLVSRLNLLFQDHDDALERMPVDQSALVVADRCFRLPIRYITAALVKQDLHSADPRCLCVAVFVVQTAPSAEQNSAFSSALFVTHQARTSTSTPR